MRVKLPLCLSLRPFLLLLQSALLIFVASAISGPARADDCSTAPDTCLHEVLTSQGSSRILSVTINKTNDFPDWYNVIVPGHPQAELKVGGTLTLSIQPDGTATYSVQACWHNVATSNCNGWAQITRSFAPASTCQSYMDAAMTAINQSDNLGCGFNGSRWDHNALDHLNACLKFVGDWQSFVNNETSGRANDLAACKTRIAAATPCPPGQIRLQGNCQAPPVLPGSTTGSGGGFIQMIPSCPQGQIQFQGKCQAPPVLAGSSTGSGGGFIQMIPTCPSGQTYSANEKRCVATNSPPSTGGGATGTPPMQQTNGACGTPGAMATVVINQPGLDKLNVRSGPGGKVIGTVPEGATVSVVGECGAIGGAGFAMSTASPTAGGNNDWCQIRAPISGCVGAEFLQFGGANADTTLPSGAAGFAKSNGQQQASAPAGFGGRWRANADNVAYSITLMQKGSSVSGSYQGSDRSTGAINGTVNGNVLRFAWVQTDGNRGSGKFVLSSDGRSFQGSYSLGNNPDDVKGSWNGVRQ